MTDDRRAVPETKADRSGFRRLGYSDAIDVLEVAHACRDLPEGGTTSTAGESDEARALDAVADRLWPGGVPYDPCNADGATRFALAADVANHRRRLRAIVARAYARADAVAWCMAQDRDDAKALAEGARAIDEALKRIDPAYHRDDAHFRVSGYWVRDSSPVDRIERACRADWRARLGADVQEPAWESDVARAAAALARKAAEIREITDPRRNSGRPTTVTPRVWFVLRLALAFTFATGKRPVFDGGTPGEEYDLGGPRMYGSPWHDLLNASLDLTGVRNKATTDAVSRSVATAARVHPALPDNYFVMSVNRLASAVGDGGGWWRDYQAYGALPGVGLETDVGLDISRAPATREEAYRPPESLSRGRAVDGT